VACLGNRKIRSNLLTNRHRRPSARSVLSCIGVSQVRVQYLFTRSSDTTRLLARLVRPGQPLGDGLPTHHSGPLEPVRQTVGSTVCACEKTPTDTDRCVSPPNRSCGSHMKFPAGLGESNPISAPHTASASLTLDLT
jgi:hypothetical protein